MQDDALLLHRPAELPRTVRTLRALGVDRVRINATWSQIAPKEDGPRNWGNLDRAVNAVTRAGMRVMIDVGFFAPRWAGGSRAPDPEKLAGFAGTLAERYPQVRLWTIWNEPNHPVFMQPQWRGGVPVSPHVYRRMHQLGYEAIKKQSEDNRVLLGGLTSMGGDGRGGVRPLRFLRELACVDERLQPLRRTECSDFEPLSGRRVRDPPLRAQAAPEPSGLPNPDDVGHRRPRAAVAPAGRPGRARPHRGSPAGLRDRVRLRDRPARPQARRRAAHAGRVPTGRRGRGARPPGRAHARAVPAARPGRRRPVPDGAAAARRQAQARVVHVPGLVRRAPGHRPGPGAARPGPARRWRSSASCATGPGPRWSRRRRTPTAWCASRA